jgi:hypothetical protein
MDCFGPFYVKEARKELKRYGLLFTYLHGPRAVHFEIFDDMTINAFINALRCFVALRGQVCHIRCHRGTNFVGEKHELKLTLKETPDEERIKTFLSTQNCEFIMNSPASSHMGGVWERQTKTVRSVLTSILDQANGHPDTSSLQTFLYEDMTIVNSRPLTVDNLNDPQGPLPRTPNHILTMKYGIVLPPPGDFDKAYLYERKRWKKVQYLAYQFWVKWKTEYLQSLQARTKWTSSKRVSLLIGEPNLYNIQKVSVLASQRT